MISHQQRKCVLHSTYCFCQRIRESRKHAECVAEWRAQETQAQGRLTRTEQGDAWTHSHGKCVTETQPSPGTRLTTPWKQTRMNPFTVGHAAPDGGRLWTRPAPPGVPGAQREALLVSSAADAAPVNGDAAQPGQRGVFCDSLSPGSTTIDVRFSKGGCTFGTSFGFLKMEETHTDGCGRERKTRGLHKFQGNDNPGGLPMAIFSVSLEATGCMWL